MPTYDYQCENGHHFEIFQKMTDPKIETCPQCGARAKRMIGPGAGIVFKGSGFYSTDYRSEKYKRAAKSETAGGGATADSGTKSEPGAATPGGATPAGPAKAAKKEKSPPGPAAGGAKTGADAGGDTKKD